MAASIARSNEQPFKTIAEAVSAVRNTRCLLLTTYHELEPRVTEILTQVLPVPVYAIGPSIPLGDAHARTETMHNMEAEYCLKWLDAQPESSVLYVSFGSFLSASGEQMEEILAGLCESGVRYMLVSPGAKARIDNYETESSRSLVVPWCDQLMVLCHASVGGFWTHCGWNSTLEGVYAGVPMLAFPVGFDQISNRTLIVDCWKIGMKVMKEVGAERLVRREEVVSTVKKFMNLDGDDEESNEMRRRAGEFKKSCRRALAEGGSSTINLDNFIRDILQYHYN